MPDTKIKSSQNSMRLFSSGLCLLASTILCAPLTANAASQPDAGRTLQELQTPPQLPAKSPDISIQQQPTSPATSGGTQVQIHAITFEGNTIFSDKELGNITANAIGNTYDLAGLKELANKITTFYHEQDYPFARAFIPAQAIKNGTLEIQIVEGRYGETIIKSNSPYTGTAQKHLSPLKRNTLIKGKQLERTSLLLDDQPGYKITPIIRPGQDIGTGDLSFIMEADNKVGGTIRGDNHGNRYTGQLRTRADLYANSQITFGDQTTFSAIYTQENMWYGSLGYSLPIGYDGLRARASYTHTYYELGKQFASLDATGTADVANIGLSYPLLRSQKTNFSLSADYRHKWLKDKEKSSATTNHKTSHTLPLVLSFDHRDELLGGGITYGALSWTHGYLNLDNELKATDKTTANTQGHFDKFNLDVARLQATPVENLVLFARASGQIAANNLDSSEDFGLGGPDGVRAYPTGESYGDEGVLTQIEARYTIDSLTPYVFYDYGRSITNQNSWDSGDNTRSIGGFGLGTRLDYKGITADASAAWRTVGGDPQSDDKDKVPMLWFSLGYQF